MVFSSNVFLYVFLPLVLGGHFLLPAKLRNTWLVAASLFFYGWGEPIYVVVMLGSIAANYLLALAIDVAARPGLRRAMLALTVFLNLAMLAWFKYACFAVENLNALLSVLHVPPMRALEVHLPIGISFFTFHALSYVIDVYRREVRAQTNPMSVALTITLFSQLVAGPIIRYTDIADQIRQRSVTLFKFSEGVHRFVWGLGKKMFIANTLGAFTDKIVAIPSGELPCTLAWLGILCYTLQIYFDFSGYSDMAIGLGHMFGFTFKENFEHPYIARSVAEFWRRWHISLSTWFRDYLYIPLGGSRVSPWRTYCNLWIVFLLCGLWHGATWNFVIWGALHGCLLVAERAGLGILLARLWAPLAHLYVLVMVAFTWVFFRLENLPAALNYLVSMFGRSGFQNDIHPLALYLNGEVIAAMVLGIVFCMPIGRYVKARSDALALYADRPWWPVLRWLGYQIDYILLVGTLFVCMTYMAAGTYNPFIYFRF